jgi:arginine decarboxylase
VPVDLLDVGGGMAVDYDGSKTAFDSSANYSAQEFANDVIYTIKQVCDDENVPHPTIIQESGRYLAAYHAILVTNVQDEIEPWWKTLHQSKSTTTIPRWLRNSATCARRSR